MKREHALKIAVATLGLMLVAYAAVFLGHSGSKVEVRYGDRELPLKKDDLQMIQNIVSRQRWAALYRAVGRRDSRYLRESTRQLVFGRLRWIGCEWWSGSPAVVAMYEDTKDGTRSFKYALRYHKNQNRWTFAGYTYYDSTFEIPEKESLRFP